MGRVSKEELARRDGMAYALRIAKEFGIEYLEKDIKARGGMLQIPCAIHPNDLNLFCEKVRVSVLDTMLILSAATLKDEFGFGQKRIQRFLDRLGLKADCLAEGYCTWEDYLETLKEELNIELELRLNNEDVKIQ